MCLVIVMDTERMLLPPVRVHMGPGNYGFFPVHFLPTFWPRYSLFTIEK